MIAHPIRSFRLAFVVIFLAISLPVTYLLHRSLQHLQTEADFTLKERAYLVLQLLNQRIYDDLAIEERRSYNEYRFIRAVPVIGGEEVTVSDLARYPVHSHYVGLVGHFQMEPDGSVRTPVLPDGLLEKIPVENKREREKLRDTLVAVLQRLDVRHTSTVKPPTARTNTSFLDRDSMQKLYGKDFKLMSILSEERLFRRRLETSSTKEAIVFDVESKTLKELQRLQQIDSTALVEALFREGIREVEIDPFQTVFDQQYLVYFRNVWRNGQRFIQGYVVDLRAYLGNIVLDQLQFNPTGQGMGIAFGDRNNPLVGFGTSTLQNGKEIFEIPLQYPLNEMWFKVLANRSAQPPGTGMILMLGLLMFVVLLGGLFGIYKITSTQMKVSAKRQDFISAVSHELKTPLTSIRMYAELLQNQWVSSEEKRQHYYNMIASETDRLTRLIQNVLKLSSLERNKWKVNMQPANPAKFLEEFVQKYSATVEQAGFQLECIADACDFHVSMDKDALVQVLMNLVENSLKFAKDFEPRIIRLQLTIRRDDVCISVRDHGPGIPTSELDRVFDEFYRLENEMTRRTSGTGIGLSLVRKLCKAMDMEVRISNAQPGLLVEIHFNNYGL